MKPGSPGQQGQSPSPAGMCVPQSCIGAEEWPSADASLKLTFANAKAVSAANSTARARG